MPVNGPTGPTGPRPLSTSNTTPAPTTTPAVSTGPAAPVAARGWSAPVGGGVTPASDGFRTGTATATVSGPPSAMELQVKGAINTFNSNVEVALHHDAMSLARGERPTREGDPLSQQQQKDLTNAATDLLRSMPIGALSPDLAAGLQSTLRDRGLSDRDIASTKLGDLGGVGGDVIKKLLGQLKENSPTAFYSLGATAAVAAGALAWSGGSKKLEQLGIKPEIKQGFFDDQLKLKLKAEFGPHLSNFTAVGTVEANVKVSENGRLTGQVTADTRNGLQSAGIGYTLDRPDFRLSAGVDHDFRTNVTTAQAEAAWKVRQNVDFALSASHNSQGESRVGVGVNIRF